MGPTSKGRGREGTGGREGEGREGERKGGQGREGEGRGGDDRVGEWRGKLGGGSCSPTSPGGVTRHCFGLATEDRGRQY